MKYLKKYYISIIVLAAVLLATIYFVKPFGFFGSSQDSGLKTVIVQKGNLSETINASGQISAPNEATMGFLGTGRVGWVGVREGDPVVAFQVLASFDNIQNQAAVSKAEASLKSAQSSLDKVLDDIHLYQYGNGGFGNVGSSSETQTQKSTREQAEMARDAAFFDLQSARKALELTTIISPFNGVVAKINSIVAGQNYTPGTGTITVVETGNLKFIAWVDEIDIAKLQPGQTGEVTIDAFPDEKFTGKITKIGVSANRPMGGGANVLVEVSLQNDNRFKSGFSGEADFVIAAKENVITLPKSSIHGEKDNKFVYLKINGKPVKGNIKEGQSLGNQVEVISGLDIGEEVITAAVK